MTFNEKGYLETGIHLSIPTPTPTHTEPKQVPAHFDPDTGRFTYIRDSIGPYQLIVSPEDAEAWRTYWSTHTYDPTKP